MKLTVFSRVLIALLIAAGVYFAYTYFTGKPQESEVTTTTEEQVTPVPEEQVNEPTQTQTVQPGRTFRFTPPAPTNGKLKGVVELGASGFNSFIINVDAQKNWALEKAEFGASLVYENMATEEDVRAGLKQYIAKMLDYGVGAKDIHFVVSSSAIKAEAVPKIRAGLKTLGYYVNTVTAEQEGIYALKAALPMAYEGKAFVVDIGSGNTKVSWVDESGKVKSLETYGSKYYQNGITDEAVYKEVSSVAAQVPLPCQTTCFMIGGAPFELAKTHRNAKERYTVLKKPDEYKLSGEKIRAGLNIIKGIRDNTECETFVFDWDANFTIGFLLSI